MTPHRTTFDTPSVRRSPWVVVVDAALPVVPSFWALVDFGNAVVGRLARHGSRHLGSPGFPGAAR